MNFHRRHVFVIALGLTSLIGSGCNNGSNTDMSYKAAINDHFKSYPTCIWSQAKKFPVQAATSDDAKTETVGIKTAIRKPIGLKRKINCAMGIRLHGLLTPPLETVARAVSLAACCNFN